MMTWMQLDYLYPSSDAIVQYTLCSLYIISWLIVDI
jgi:hypothetical protein